MNILFLGTTGIHHTLLAAYMYLGYQVPIDYKNLRYWNDRDSEASGYPLYLANDAKGNKVYCLGVGWDVVMAQKSIKQLVKILNCNDEDLKIKPIFINKERIIFFLHRIGRFKIANHLVLQMIVYLLRSEIPGIRRQLEDLVSGSD